MVKTPAAPTATPPSVSGGTPSHSSIDQTLYQRNLFLVMAANMTWQLAIVVLVPVVGGFKLDEHYDSSPWFTLLGVVIAAAGMTLVLLRVVKQAAQRVSKGPGASA
jgi:F0F1-type ATP synthase assembly protein I